jgi:2-desacetyl-2-hydroxyethyl bacteriochlorophyllide A dehydrogenase
VRLTPLPDTALAVLCPEPGTVRLGEVRIPDLAPDEVLIRTLVSGVSTGTDKWVMNGSFEWGGFSFPLVPGYQRIGIVEDFGSEVRSLQVDDIVFATSSRDFVGAAAGWGGHAHWAVSVQPEVFPAHGVSRLSGALAVSVQVGVNAASRLTRPREQRVVVIGDGIIGVSAALAALERGCSVLLAGHHDDRLRSVQNIHDDLAIVNTHQEWQEVLNGWSPTSVIDTVQNHGVVSDYVPSLPCTWNSEICSNPRTGIAEIVFAGHSPGGVTTWADMALLQKQEVTVHFVSGWTRQRILLTLELLRSGRINLDPFIETVRSRPHDVDTLMSQVMGASMASIAACIEWGES